ncbi:alpha/beta hydrolase [Xanthomonas sp. 3307]|uniref:alpha/beta fold hydrolase n=1 Tax=Xanthomonas sp. 3307 TaxID=3035316 RepID=UPI00161C8D8C|nr:alpha/beta hydrolase [Xanthomonas sp. 3307]MBB5942817.1 haloacetate dehalogenase [Xanthomonas sp. 3307]
MSIRHCPAPSAAFPGFSRLQVDAGGVAFAGAIGGAGPPLLLLHGFPQTHLAWRRVAPQLAQAFTVIVPDLPGYGASRTHSDQPRWSKRRVGEALVALMAQLGHTRFAVVGHDRGARAGYRLALDHPDRVTHYASLTVVPTQDAWDAMDMRHGLASFHWFLLAQPFDLPERLLAADPDAFIETVLARMAGGLDRLDPAVRAAYTAAFRDPAVRHAICEDYRAAVNEDLEHDAADRAAGNILHCPVLVLWPQAQAAAPSPLALWRRWASDVSGKAISGGHLQPEYSSQEVLAELLPFLSRP